MSPRSRPVTKNIASVIDDGAKIEQADGGIVAFVLFPVPSGDHRWRIYLVRIATGLGLSLCEADHCSRVTVEFTGGDNAEMIVCAFAVPSARGSRRCRRTSACPGRPVCSTGLL